MRQNSSYRNLLAISIMLILSLSVFSIQDALAAGLKVYLNIYHKSNVSARLCVDSVYQSLGCRTINLAGLTNPYTSAAWTFGDNVIPVNGQFKACATNLANNQYKCVMGTNSPAQRPEYVSITLPISTPGGRTASNQDLKNS